MTGTRYFPASSFRSSRNPGPRRPPVPLGWALVPLRGFLGFTFTFAGLQKLANPAFFDPKVPTSLQGQLRAVRHGSPISFLLGPVSHHAVLFGVLIALGELVVGLATLLGLFQRLAAALGMVLAASFFLTISWHTSPYYYGSDIVFLFAWTPLLITGAAGVLSLDSVLFPQGLPRRAPQTLEERRAVLRAGGYAGALGGLAVVAAALDAAVGRAAATTARRTAAPAGRSASHPPATARHTQPPPSASRSPGRSAAKGTPVVAVGQVPVGSAAAFQDPTSGDPAYVVHPSSGQFKAFSAICPHAGCTVGYSTGDRLFHCPCHGSTFDGRTGQVLVGPAQTGLDPIRVQVSGGEVYAED